MRSRGISNNVPEIRDGCEGCFAIQDGHFTALTEIIDDCPFKKMGDRSEDGRIKQGHGIGID